MKLTDTREFEDFVVKMARECDGSSTALGRETLGRETCAAARALLSALDREKAASTEPPKRTAEDFLEKLTTPTSRGAVSVWHKEAVEALRLVRELRADGEKWAAENRELREEKAELREERDGWRKNYWGLPNINGSLVLERDELARRIEKAKERAGKSESRCSCTACDVYRILSGTDEAKRGEA